MLVEQIEVQLPPIAGLSARPYGGDADVHPIVALINASHAADGIDWRETVEGMRGMLRNTTGIDPARDMLIVERAGEPVAWARVRERDQSSGERCYYSMAVVQPDLRGRGIGTALAEWMERNARVRLAMHPTAGPAFLQAWCDSRSKPKAALLERLGFTAARYSFEMVRPLDAPIPDYALPDGLEIRPVTADMMRAIWEADVEASADHWGYVPPSEDDYAQWLANPLTQPELFKVACDTATGEVAGMVQNFIDQEENTRMNRMRGYTENISTRRKYRRRGVARALICVSLRMHRELGMTEAALGVDTENTSGALRVYLDCGFRPIRQDTIYRKSL